MACNDIVSIGFSPLYSGGQFNGIVAITILIPSVFLLSALEEKEPLFGCFVSRNGSGNEYMEMGAVGVKQIN